jgi:hypothetical protein
MVVATFVRRSIADASLYGFSARTRLSASAFYARSISFEKSRTILRPCDTELLTVQFVVP